MKAEEMTIQEIKKAIDFNILQVKGCLITHEHQDHCKGIHDVIKAGINTDALNETHTALGTSDRQIKYKKKWEAGLVALDCI